VDLWIGGPGEDDVFGDAVHLLRVPLPPEQKLVELGFPRPKTRTGPRAAGATPVAVPATPRTAFSLKMKWLVDAVGVVVAEHVMRARHHATGATGAEP
jgi:hypothetical protein